MADSFKVGDRVRWNSEAGEIHGRVTKVHTKDFEFLGRTRRCSEDEPQYEVQSDKTDNLAVHKGSALRKAG